MSVENPETGRIITIGKAAYNRLIKQGYVLTEDQTNPYKCKLIKVKERLQQDYNGITNTAWFTDLSERRIYKDNIDPTTYQQIVPSKALTTKSKVNNTPAESPVSTSNDNAEYITYNENDVKKLMRRKHIS